MRRIARRVITGLLIVLTVYLIAGNIFLNTGIGPWAINRKPERFSLQWSHGLTWWPGQVALWNVEARGQVRRMQWSAQADHARGRIAVLPLLSRELRLPFVEASEVRGTLDQVATDLQPPPSGDGGWTLRFDRLATRSLRQWQLGPFTLATDGVAEVGIFKQLRGGPLELMPSHATLAALQIRKGETVLLRDARAEASLAIARHRREDASGLARLGLADSRLQLSGTPSGVGVELDSTGQWRGHATAQAGGSLDLDLDWRRGEFQPGGRVELRLPLDADRGTSHASAEAQLHIAINDAGMSLKAALPAPPESHGSLHADLVIRDRQLLLPLQPRSLLPRIDGSVNLDWRFDSLAWLGPMLMRAPWLTLDGAGQLVAELQLREGRLQAGSHVEIPDVQLSALVAGHHIRGQARASGRIENTADAPRAVVELDLPRYEVMSAAAPDIAMVRGKDLRIDLQAPDNVHSFRDSARAHLRFADAQIPDLGFINAWLPTATLELKGGSTTLGADLELDATGSIERGRVAIKGRNTRLRLGETGLAGDFDLDANLDDTDLAVREFDLSGTRLALRNVSVVDAGRTAGENWWARMALKRGRIAGAAPFSVDADLGIEMQNVGLLMALFSRHKDYPGWAIKLADKGNLQANGKLRAASGAIVIDRLEASNERFDLKARLHLANRKARGDLLLGWHALALGLELDGDKRQFHLLKSRAWYASRPDLLGKSAAAR